MKQYRITSANFVLPGETCDADAVMDAADLAEIKKLAGLVTEAEGGVYAGIGQTPITNTTDSGITSPVGSNISATAETRNELMAKYHAKPGTDLWFIINFTKPYLTGGVETKIKEYLKQHPEAVPKTLPGG